MPYMTVRIEKRETMPLRQSAIDHRNDHAFGCLFTVDLPGNSAVSAV